MNFYTNVALAGSKILYRGIHDGKRVKKKVGFEPTLFVPGDGDWKAIDGTPLRPVKPGSIYECRDYLDLRKDVANSSIFGNTDWQYQFIAETFPEPEVKFDPEQIRIGFIDIEVETEEGFAKPEDPRERINAITLKVGKKRHIFALGQFHIDDPNTKCFCFDNELELLSAFLDSWEAADIDVISGWSIQTFDIPYLVNRIIETLGDADALRLSPWRSVKEKIRKDDFGNDRLTFELVGIATLDYLELYKKFTFVKRASNKLDHIAEIELGERKVSYEEYDSIKAFYKGNFQKFIEYNAMDVELVAKLEEKLKLMSLVFAVAYAMKVNWNDVFSPVKTWDMAIFHYLHSQKIAIPLKKLSDKGSQYAGAFVKEPIVGRHEWVVSYDAQSLYPSLIRCMNVSPDTITTDGKTGLFTVDEYLAGTLSEEAKAKIEEWTSNDLAVAANGMTYRRDKQGFLTKLTEDFFLKRKAAKAKAKEFEKQAIALEKEGKPKAEIDAAKAQAKIFSIEEQARKVGINSLYGAVGNNSFRYYSRDMAETITLTGQLVIQWLANQLNPMLNKVAGSDGVEFVVSSDTDSLYIKLDALVTKFCLNKSKTQTIDFLKGICDKVIGPLLEAKCKEFVTTFNFYENHLVMNRESIADVGIWTAKKRYMLNVWDSEGIRYLEPKIKIKGIETARSATPAIVKKALLNGIKAILNGTEEELQKQLSAFRKEFDAASPESISFAMSCNNLATFADPVLVYQSGTPIQVKGALVYNRWLADRGLEKKYPAIGEGEKVKYVYLKKPNPFGMASIAFPGTPPKEMNLERFADYDTQWEKAVQNPIERILSVIGWSTEKQADLTALFEED